MKNSTGENLIFLISQPRAGSTLLQRILAGHPEIHTTAEPWIMLHPLYALKRQGYTGEYEAKLARDALDDFLPTLEEGEETYIKAVRGMALDLYKSCLAGTGKSRFLDKTPRYYFIIPELFRVFPDANYIFLLRNPLAILFSILNTWVKGKGQPFSQYKHDLLPAPRLLAEALKRRPDKAIVVHYEDMVAEPEKVVSGLCNSLHLSFHPPMIHYGRTPTPAGRLGDDARIQDHTKPTLQYIDSWISGLAPSPERNLAEAYLSFLGQDLLCALGYSAKDLRQKLRSVPLQGSPADQQKVRALLSQIGLLEAPEPPSRPAPHSWVRQTKQILCRATELLPANDVPPPDNIIKHLHEFCGPGAEFNKGAVLQKINTLCTQYILNDAQFRITNALIDLQENIFDLQLQHCLISYKNYIDKDYLITAIVSTYSDEAFMQECLEDLESQTIADRLEIIVIDAASPQNERAVVEAFQNRHTNIKYLRTESRIGVYAAWNLAIRLAGGKYITPFSTNDRLSRHAYDKLSSQLQNGPDSALVYGDTYITDNPHETFDRHTQSKKVPQNFQWTDFSYKELIQRPLVGPHPMWRKSVHRKVGYFDEQYIALGDQEFWLRLGERYKLRHIKDFTGLYWWTENALSSSADSDIPAVEEAGIREMYRKRYAARQKQTAAATNGLPLQEQRPVNVSVIIPVCNNAGLTAACLRALSQNTRYPHYEVIIIDNGSVDETRQLLKGLSGNVDIITNKENLGFARACNQGADRAEGEYLLFLNNDTEVRPGWMEQLVGILQNDPEVAAAGSKLLYPDGTIQHAGVIIVDDKTENDPLMATNVYRKQPDTIPQADRKMTYQALTGACLLIRKSCFMRAGGFYEGFRNGYEDVDLCFKLQQMGWKLVYQPDSVAIHYESKSGPERFAAAAENIKLLHSRWLGKIKADYIAETHGALLPTDADKIRPYVGPPSDMPKNHSGAVSIIIPTHNQADYTLACIESISLYTPEPFEIIIVDNGSTDNTPARIQALCNPAVRVITNAANRGFACACNQGIKAAGGAYIAILNNDILVTKGWLAGLLNALQRDPHIGMAGPLSNYVGTMEQFNGPATYNDLQAMEQHAAALRRRNSGTCLNVTRLMFFCVLIRRALLDGIGPLDESFAIGNYEDDDFCWRAKAAGWKMVVARDVFLHHFGSKTFSAHGRELNHERLMQINGKRFCTKWGITPEWYKSYINRPPGNLLVETELSRFVRKNSSPDIAADKINSAVRLQEETALPDNTLSELNTGPAGSSIQDSTRQPIAASVNEGNIFSVVIATYNRPDVVRQCLQSLASQTFPAGDFEVLVCDDGSTDNTQAALKSIATPFKLTCLYQENRGPASARNLGIRHASGKYLLFLDDDVFLSPDGLSHHYRTLTEYTGGTCAVLGKIAGLPEFVRSLFAYVLDHSDLMLACPVMDPGHIYDYNYFYTGNISIPRQAVLDAGMFDESFTGVLWGAEDIELGYRLFEQGCKIVYNADSPAWHAQPLVPENFYKKCIIRGGGAVRIFAKHPEMPCHYNTITLEAVHRWRHVDGDLSLLMEELLRLVDMTDRVLLPENMPFQEPFSESRFPVYFMQQWILRPKELCRTVKRFIDRLRDLSGLLTRNPDPRTFTGIARQLYPAVNFLKWYYDTVGITGSPCVEQYIDAQAKVESKKAATKIYCNKTDVGPFSEIFRRKFREGNVSWSALLSLASMLLNQPDIGSSGSTLLSEGIYCLEKIFDLKPHYADTLKALLSIYQRQNRTRESALLQQHLDCLQSVTDGNGKLQAAYGYLSSNDYDKASLYFLELLNENGDDLAVSLEVFDLYLRGGRLDQAEKIIKKLADDSNGNNPFSFSVWKKWGELEYLRGNYDKSFKLLTESLRKQPDASTLNLLAEVKLRTGIPEQAADAWKKSLQLNPLQIPVYLKLFDCIQGPVVSKRTVDKTAVTVVLNSENTAGACKQSLERLAKTDIGKAGIIVVNNGSAAAADFLQTTQTCFPANRLVVMTPPRHNGHRSTIEYILRLPENDNVEFIAFIDDDVLLPADWLQLLIDTLDGFPDAAVAGPKVVCSGTPNTIHQIYRFIDAVCDHKLRLSGMHRHEPDFGQFDFFRKCLSVAGCCRLIKMRVAAKTGPGPYPAVPMDDTCHAIATALLGNEVVYNGHLEVAQRQKTVADLKPGEVDFGNGGGNVAAAALKNFQQQMLGLKAETENRDRQDIRDKINRLRNEGYLEGVPAVPFGIV